MDTKTYKFRPMGFSYLIPGNTTAPTGVQVLSPNDESVSYRISNVGSADAWVAAADSADAAQAAAVAPTAGTPKAATYLKAGETLIARFPANSYFSAITVGSASNIAIQAGEGL